MHTFSVCMLVLVYVLTCFGCTVSMHVEASGQPHTLFLLGDHPP